VLLAALVAWPLVARGQGESPAELSEVVIVERDVAVEVWVRLRRPAKYQAELIDSPWRLVLDLEDTAYRWSVRPQLVGVDPVRELRGSQYRKGVARLVIELQRKVEYVVEQDREGLRIVLPLAVLLDEQRHAYIFDPATRQVRRYAVGDAVGKSVVETIGEWSVVLKTPTGRVELRVDETKPSAPQPRR